jgi:hypothetical protein
MRSTRTCWSAFGFQAGPERSRAPATAISAAGNYRGVAAKRLLIDGSLVCSGRRSSRMSLIDARTSWRQSCIHADRLSDRFVTDSDESGAARPSSRDPSRHCLGPPGFDRSQRERTACGWRLLSEGLGRCPRRASSGFHPKRQTPFRVKEEREDGVAFSAPEKPPDACTPAARREGRVAAQCCATTRRRKR